MINPQKETGYLTVLNHTFGIDEKIDYRYYMHLVSNIEPIKIRTLCAPNYTEELWVITNCERIMLARLTKEKIVGHNCFKYDWLCNFVSILPKIN